MSVTGVAPYTRSVPGLLLSISAEDGAMLIAARGELDNASVPTLMDVLIGVLADCDGDVVVDLAHADFIDSAAVRALTRAAHFLSERKRRLSIRSPSRLALRVLTIHGLCDLLE
ncbi:MAG: hypothetical protein QOD92_4300 [Acidimicrobiaceae bacterium]